MDSEQEVFISLPWDDLVEKLKEFAENVPDIINVFTARINKTYLKLNEVELSQDDRKIVQEFIEDEFPAMVEIIYFSTTETCDVLRVQNFFGNVLKFATMAFKISEVLGGPDTLNSLPLLHVFRLLVGGMQVPRRFSITKSSSSDLNAQSSLGSLIFKPGNFFLEHGRPLLRSYQGRNLYIWPDNTGALRVAEEGKGWNVELLDPMGTKLPGSIPGLSRWVQAEILGKNSNPDQVEEHQLRFASSHDAPDVMLSLNLATFDIIWLDRNGPTPSSNSSTRKSPLVAPSYENAVSGEAHDREQSRLLQSPCDTGAEIQVWPAQAQRHAKAEVVSYSLKTGLHELAIAVSKDHTSTSTKQNMNMVKHVVISRPEGWIRRPVASTCPNLSLCQLRNIELFGLFGGFEALAHHLFYVKHPSADEILSTIGMVWEIFHTLAPSRIEQVAWTIKESVPRALLSMSSEELRQVPKEALLECVSRISTMVRNASPGVSRVSPVAIEQLKLGLALKLFRCPQLSKKLQGLMVIRELIVQVDTPVRTPPLGALESAPRPFSWADAPSAQKWLIHGGFVEELFGGSCHAELAQRSEPVLLFLARRGALTVAHLEALWACTEGRHEATARVLHTLALGIVPALAPHLRLYLFSCAAATPFSRYSPQTLQFVHDFTICALQAARTGHTAAPIPTAGEGLIPTNEPSTARLGTLDLSLTGEAGGGGSGLRKGQVVHCPERAWLGFGVLWQFVMGDPSGGTGGIGAQSNGTQLLSVEITKMAVDLLVSLLSEPEITPERGPLVARCLENLHQRRSVAVSLMVLQKAISTLPSQPVKWFDKVTLRGNGSSKDMNSVASTLEGLQRGGDLLGVLLEELEAYCYCIRRRYGGANRQLNSSTRVKVYGFPTRFTHVEHLRARLDFIMFALTRSSIGLTESQLDTIWRCLVDEVASPEAEALSMEWLQYACADPSNDDHAGLPNNALISNSSEEFPHAAAFSPALRSYLFEMKLCALCLKPSIHPAAARLFLFLFLQINSKTRAIQRERPSRTAIGTTGVNKGVDSDNEMHLLTGWVRQSSDLVGIDSLWCIVLDADNPEVSKTSSVLLVNLHRRFGSRMGAVRSEKVREQFTQMCLSHMAESTAEPSNEQILGADSVEDLTSSNHRRKRRLRRCVSLLHSFLQWSANKRKENVKLPSTAKVQVLFGPQLTPILEISVPATLSVGDLHAEIAHYFDELPSQIELTRRVPQRAGAAPSSMPIWQTLEPSIQSLETAGFLPTAVLQVSKISRAGDQGTMHTPGGNEGGISGGNSVVLSPLMASQQSPDFISLEDLHDGFSMDVEPSTWDLLSLPPSQKGMTIRALRRNARRSLNPFRSQSQRFNHSSSQVQDLPESQHPRLKRKTIRITKFPESIHRSSKTRVQVEPQDPHFGSSGRHSPPKPDSSSPSSADREAVSSSPTGTNSPPRLRPCLNLPDWQPPLVSKGGILLSIPGGIFSVSKVASRASISALISLGGVKESISGDLDGSDKGSSGVSTPPLPLSGSSHFEQLFSMLDIDFDETGEEESLSAGVWRVLQALPVHAGLVEDLRSLKKMRESNYWALLLNPTSSYKLLYVLQIIDAFMSTPSGMNGGGDAALKWAVKFNILGGVDHLSNVLSQIAEQLITLRTEKEAQKRPVRGLEPMALSCAYIFRALHRFFQLEPDYMNACSHECRWEIAKMYHARVSPSNHVEEKSNAVAFYALQAGAVTDAMTITEALVRCNAPNEPLLSAVCHGLSLITTAVTASPVSLRAASCPDRLHSWLRALLLRASDTSIRRVVAGLLYRACEVVHQCNSKVDTLASGSSSSPKYSSTITPTLLSTTLLESLVSMFEALRPWDADQNDHPPEKKWGEVGGILVPRANTGEFLGLLGGLLHLWMQMNGGSEPAGIIEVRAAKEAAKRLANHHFSETLMSEVADTPLVGLFRILFVLVWHSLSLVKTACNSFLEARNGEQGLLEFIYLNCLFEDDLSVVHEECAEEEETVSKNKNGKFLLGPKCQSEESRAAAFALAAQLVADPRDDESLLIELLKLMGGHDLLQKYHEDSVEKPDIPCFGEYGGSDLSWKWDYDPADLVKEAGQHGGLVNQGATCYLNSVLQQLFHIRRFSGPLMGITPTRVPGREEFEDVLFKLQTLFASLHVGQRRYHDTRPFCSVFRDYDGRPMQLVEQKDAYEFCSMLMDKLERSSETAQELVKKTFGGMLQYQILPCEPSCTHSSVRNEPFLILTAEVQNKDTLASALDLFTAGEALDGDNKYMCEHCGKRVTAQRRCSIQNLPPVIILHLKRFEFNLETMTRHKLNHRCTFPMTLDMEPWTVEGIEMRESHMTVRSRTSTVSVTEELNGDGSRGVSTFRRSLQKPFGSMVSMAEGVDETHEEGVSGERPSIQPLNNSSHRPYPPEYYQYQLKGVVAHVGTADSGHYYSFIKVANESWLEFNDRLVTPFDEANIPKECFGGADTDAPVQTGDLSAQTKLKSNSAYLLLYERIASEKDTMASVPRNGTLLGPEVPCPPTLQDIPDEESEISDSDPNSELNTSSATESRELKSRPSLMRGRNSSNLLERRLSGDRGRRKRGMFESLGGSVDWSTLMIRAQKQSAQKLPELSREVMQAVGNENATLFRDTHRFHPDFLRFVWAVLGHANSRLDSQLVCTLASHVGLQVGIEVVARAKAKSLLPHWCARIQSLACSHSYAAQNFLLSLATSFEPVMLIGSKQGTFWIHSILVSCPHQATRVTFSKLIANVVKKHCLENNEGLNIAFEVFLTVLLDLLEASTKIVKSGSRAPFNISHILNILAEAGGLNPCARNFLATCSGIRVIVEAWSWSNKISLISLNTPKTSTLSMTANTTGARSALILGGEDSSGNLLKTVVELVAALAKDLPHEFGGIFPADASQSILESSVLNKAIHSMPESVSIIATAIAQGHSITNASANALYITMKDLCFSSSGASLNECAGVMRPYLKVLHSLLHIQDGFESARVESILSWLVPCVSMILERRGTTGGVNKLGVDEAEVVQSTCRMLLSVAVHVPLARQKIEVHRATWEVWASAVGSALPSKASSSSNSRSGTSRIAFR